MVLVNNRCMCGQKKKYVRSLFPPNNNQPTTTKADSMRELWRMSTKILVVLGFLVVFCLIHCNQVSEAAASDKKGGGRKCSFEVSYCRELQAEWKKDPTKSNEEKVKKCFSELLQKGVFCSSEGEGEEKNALLWDLISLFAFEWNDIPQSSSILFHLLQQSTERGYEVLHQSKISQLLDDGRASSNHHRFKLELLKNLLQHSTELVSSSAPKESASFSLSRTYRSLSSSLLNLLTTLADRTLKLDCDLALQAFSFLQPLRPEDALVNWGLGHSLARCKERSVAERQRGAEHIQLSLVHDSELGEAYYDLGEYAVTIGQLELAGRYFKRSAWLYPRNFKGEKQDIRTGQFALNTVPNPFGMGAMVMTDILMAGFDERETQLSRLNFLLREGTSVLEETGQPFIPSRYSFLVSGPENFALSSAKREASWILRDTRDKYPPLPDLTPSTYLSAPTKAKLKLGYLSSDIGQEEDSMYRMMNELASAHREEKWEVHCFQTVPVVPMTTSGTPQSLKNYTVGEEEEEPGKCSRMHDLSSMSPVQAAHYIRNIGIQILVDLCGHSRSSGMSILAFQPSPLQISFLGWPASTGASFIQYFVADRVSIPKELETDFVEKLILLPHAPVVGPHRRIVASASSGTDNQKTFSRKEEGIPEDGFLFCNFGSLSKIDSAALDFWTRILTDAKKSVLWLSGTVQDAVPNVKKEFKKKGIEVEGPESRLFFASFLPKASHLKRMELCDLYLDTFLHRSSQSVLDAIWSGVPFLTIPGFPELQRWTTPQTSFRTRLPSSILRSVLSPEAQNQSIATCVYDFQTKAISIGKQPWNWKGSYLNVKKEMKRLSQRNQQGLLLAQDQTQEQSRGSGGGTGTRTETISVLFDVPKFVESLEKGFLMAWDRYLSGKSPINLVV